MKNYPRPPAHVERFVETLGPELAFKFLLEFGGSEISLPRNPREGSRVADCVGLGGAIDLTERLGAGKHRIPVAKEWLARVLFEQGKSANAIAPILHCTDITVRRMLKASRTREQRAERSSAQLRLFP